MLWRHSLLLGLLLTFTATPWASAQINSDTFDGRPDFAEGDDFGYYVWRDGENWHVRWTTMGNMRRFHGSVTAEGGDLRSLKRIDVEAESRVVRAGRGPRVVVGPRGRAHVRRGRSAVVATREQDKIEKDGDHRIVFHSRTDGDIDGFDFKTGKKVSSIRFVLQVDGKSYARSVEIGQHNQKPSRVPFVVELD